MLTVMERRKDGSVCVFVYVGGGGILAVSVRRCFCMCVMDCVIPQRIKPNTVG